MDSYGRQSGDGDSLAKEIVSTIIESRTQESEGIEPPFGPDPLVEANGLEDP